LADSANLRRQSANFISMETSFPAPYWQFADTATFDIAFSARWQNSKITQMETGFKTLLNNV
jgi:hypothetical protein